MNAPVECERRGSLRHHINLQMIAQEISRSGIPSSATRARCQTENLSSGGCCVVLDQQCREAALLRCEILMSGCPVAIPTLARVRWVESDRQPCRAGLEFLLR